MANAHPFAGGGGGTTFENKVACLLTVDLLCARVTQLGGLVASVATQTGPDGFEDLTVGLELVDGTNALVHTQCRHRQPLTGTDKKFKALLAHGWSAVSADRAAFASRQRRLLLVVDESSPGHRSLTDLCQLARDSHTAEVFDTAITRHGGSVAARLQHCRTASGLPLRDLHSVLAAFDVLPIALDTSSARDAIELVNRLQALWDPADPSRALDLANALFTYVCDLSPRAATIDLATLQANLKANLPTTLGAGTRRAKLHRLRMAGETRVTQSLRALGVDDPQATEVALQALNERPVGLEGDVVIIVGAIGVGKTTELERQHRLAISSALGTRTQPIPIFVHARALATTTLPALVASATSGLGDPSKLGVHLSIDALDEAGLTVDDVVHRVTDASVLWPNSTVIIATRPQSVSPGTRVVPVEPLSPEAAEGLMTRIHPGSTQWLPSRAELTELLRRPLFAITYALDRRAGNVAATRPANLVASVGQRAVRDLDPRDNESFELLIALACAIVDSGGQTVELTAIGANPLQLERLARTRVVEVVDGRVAFQLAALTEWFAATAILRDPAYLGFCVRTPLAAYRWRYALVQAIRQGSDEDADRIMTELLHRVPATAAWVYDEAVDPFGNRRTSPLPGTALEIGARIRHASRQWLEPWPTIRSRYVRDGEMPVLGIAVDNHPTGSMTPHITSAWRVEPPNGTFVVPLPERIHPLNPYDSAWTGAKAGGPVDGPLWAWNWTRDQHQRNIDDLLKGRDLIASVSVCWAELAWDFAHRMLDRSSDVQSAPVPTGALEARVAKIAGISPHAREVQVGSGGYGWRLSQGQAFVEDLRRLGITHVESPWPAADSRGSWISNFWSTEQLLARLHLTTKAALDAYRELVEQVVPQMAPELPTYQLLPARVVGEVTEGDSSTGMEGEPRFSWHIEPLEAGTENESAWILVDGLPRAFGNEQWEEMAALFRRHRGELPVLTGLTIHNCEPNVYSSTPAGSLALSLFCSDLAKFGWTNRSSWTHFNAGSTRPVGW